MTGSAIANLAEELNIQVSMIYGCIFFFMLKTFYNRHVQILYKSLQMLADNMVINTSNRYIIVHFWILILYLSNRFFLQLQL